MSKEQEPPVDPAPSTRCEEKIMSEKVDTGENLGSSRGSVASIAVFKEFRLYCAHSVQSFGDDHKCSRKHGHCYKVRVEVHKYVDANTNIAMPFEEIEKAWEKVGGPLDHTDLNDKFGENPTTEVLAMYLHGQMGVALGCPCSIEVRETESSGVVIRA